jgi:mono/diheme cytochrome c family protein
MRRRLGLGTVVVVAAGVIQTSSLPAAPAEAVPPIVAGFYRLRDDVKAGDAAAGELLLGELNCTACHKAEGDGAAQRVAPKGAPDLSEVGARVTPQWIRAYLADPHGVKPGATMPDIFHASDPARRDAAVDFLTHYLVSLGGPIQPATKGGSDYLIEQGKKLYHTVGCVACHAPDVAKGEAAAMPKTPSVPLGDLASKTTVDGLALFLLDPLKSRPHGRMPASNLLPDEAEAIAVYLLRGQMDNPQAKNAEPARSRGLKFSYYEGEFQRVTLEEFEKRKPRAEGTVEGFRIDVPERKVDDGFAFKFTGAVKVPQDGRYTFFVSSDDGTRLFLDGKQIIENDGIHGEGRKSATVDLKAGEHPITVTYFEGAGDESLRVAWQGPGFNRQPIPPDALISIGGRVMVPLRSETFTVDPGKALMGRQMFALLGCASCHTVKGVESQRPAPALASLKMDSQDGCLSERVRKGVPQYHLAETQRAAIAAALKDRAALAKSPEPGERVTRTMAALNCFACHERNGAGGADGARVEHFVMTANFDMGDEGKLPPRLSGVGGKLRPGAMEKIITAGQLHVRRHHMATRMPRFPKERVAGLIRDLGTVDGASDDAGPPPAPLAARDGRTLVGTKGMGCVNCHGVGEAKSLGMPSVNLSAQFERLQWPWFRRLMIDPEKVNPGTRMPGFWTDGHVVYRDVAGGTVDGLIGAVWAYMAAGQAMPLPAGARPEGAGMELIPIDEPIVHRTFMAEVGTRAIAVGFPDNVHVAFDANQVRLAKAWKGRFFDAKGMWEGRGGAAYGPLGRDVINMPAGPAVAVLASAEAPWPVAKDRRERDVGGRFMGYRIDAQRQIIFVYHLEEVTVEEQPVPAAREGGVVLVRKFKLTGVPPPAGQLYLQAAAGRKIEEVSPGVWRVDDKLGVRVTSARGANPRVREVGNGAQLLVPLDLGRGAADCEIELSW